MIVPCTWSLVLWTGVAFCFACGQQGHACPGAREAAATSERTSHMSRLSRRLAIARSVVCGCRVNSACVGPVQGCALFTPKHMRMHHAAGASNGIPFKAHFMFLYRADLLRKAVHVKGDRARVRREAQQCTPAIVSNSQCLRLKWQHSTGVLRNASVADNGATVALRVLW